nr:MAG TPA: hypothetical protein [Caudoviricetes sp.]
MALRTLKAGNTFYTISSIIEWGVYFRKKNFFKLKYSLASPILTRKVILILGNEQKGTPTKSIKCHFYF